MIDSRELTKKLSQMLDDLNKLISEMKTQAEVFVESNEFTSDLLVNENNHNQAVIVLNGEGALQDAATMVRLHCAMYNTPLNVPWEKNTKHIRNPFKENN